MQTVNGIKFAIACALCLFMQACTSETKITGDYYLFSLDNINREMELTYKLGNGDHLGIVPMTVTAVGFNSKYIIAKQHSPDSNSLKYYIVPISRTKTHWPELGIIGPLSAGDFNRVRKTLNIDSVKFTIFVDVD